MHRFDLESEWESFVESSQWLSKLPRLKQVIASPENIRLDNVDPEANTILIYVANAAQATWIRNNAIERLEKEFSDYVNEKVSLGVVVRDDEDIPVVERPRIIEPSLFDEVDERPCQPCRSDNGHNPLKYILQVVSAILYTNIFTALIYLITVIPYGWFLTLKGWVMFLIILLGGGILFGIISLAKTFALLPYGWIVKKNVVALVATVGFLLFNFSRSLFLLWKTNAGHGILPTVFALIITGEIIFLVIGSIPVLVQMFKGETP